MNTPLPRCGSWTSLALAWTLTATSSFAHVGLRDPNGGQVLQAGSTFTIRWEATVGHNTENWDLWYSTTGDQGPWIPIAMDLPAGDISTGAIHTFDWTVPNDPSQQVRVRVQQDNTGTDWDDVSDSDLSIVGPASTYTPFGTGCLGSNGVPTLAAAAGSLPDLDSIFTVEVSGGPTGSGSGFLLVGFAAPPPIDLDGIGLTGCQLLVDIDLPISFSTTNGDTSVDLTIPNNPALIGFSFYTQALLLDATANPGGASLTNGAVAVIQ